MSDFQTTQYLFTRHLRDPETNPAPPGIEDRRMGIYRSLIYNNIEGFVSGAFPVLRSIIDDSLWHDMVRDFVARHQSITPYFLEISQEFLHYLMYERVAEKDPDFMLELAHYEWVELALDVATEVIPELQGTDLSVLDARPQVSPLVWCLTYRYPVHQLGPSYQPEEPTGDHTFLVVYRNRTDEVKFLEANIVTVRLLQLLQGGEALTGREALSIVGGELQHPDIGRLLRDGESLLRHLLALDIIFDVI